MAAVDDEGRAPARIGLDVSTLDPAQSHEFQRRLHRAGVDFSMMKREVFVPLARADDARDMLIAIAAEGTDGEDPPYDPNPFARDPIDGLGQPASRLQRLGGAVIDSLALGVVVGALAQFGVQRWVGWAAEGVIVVLMLATLGATPGKLAVETRVVDVRTGRRPNVLVAAVRWGTPSLGIVAVLVWHAAASVVIAGHLLSSALILMRSDGRAVHDLAAGTIVVRADGGRLRGGGDAKASRHR